MNTDKIKGYFFLSVLLAKTNNGAGGIITQGIYELSLIVNSLTQGSVKITNQITRSIGNYPIKYISSKGP